MPVKAFWQDETKRIMRYEIEGNWTWDEFYPEYRKAVEMEKAVLHRVDVIVNVTNTGRLPLNMLAHVRRMADEMPHNINVVVVVTSNHFLLMLFEMGSRFYPNIQRYFRIAPTLEAAHQIIAESYQE